MGYSYLNGGIDVLCNVLDPRECEGGQRIQELASKFQVVRDCAHGLLEHDLGDRAIQHSLYSRL